MGQANSNPQQQQTTSTSSDGNSRQHRDYSPSRTGERERERERDKERGPVGRLMYSKSLREKDRSSSGSGRDAGSAGKPRRKSLDMPDMSLSMSGASTPSPMPMPHAATSKQLDLPASAQSSDYPYPGLPLDSADGADGFGIPLANAPVGGAQGAANAAKWNKGLGKKSQPVTPSASVTHAVAYNHPAITQPNSPSTALQGQASTNSGKVSLPPLSTSQAPGAGPEASSVNGTRNDLISQSGAAASGAGNGPGVHNGFRTVARPMPTGMGAFHPLLHPDSLASPLSPSVNLPLLPTSHDIDREASLSQSSNAPLPVHAGPGGVPPELTIPSPLKQPVETVLAPELPAEVNIVVPLHVAAAGAHDIGDAAASTSLSGSPTAAAGVPVPAGTVEDGLVTSPLPASAAGTGASGYSSPLIPGSTPPLGNPPNTLPAAAPIAALNPTLAQDPKAQEAVQAATVDLGAGPDGVPTLLTWKAAEEDAAESDSFADKADQQQKSPQQVFVTGTFAKGWNTKIELRRKETDDKKGNTDFTALVKLPPGPHSLKFIVDKQWKTSKYLPSATDADGNLINYLQVHKMDAGQAAAAAQRGYEYSSGNYTEEEDEDGDARWTSEIPSVLLAYGEATEAALDAQEAAEREREEAVTPTQARPGSSLPPLSSGGNGGLHSFAQPGSSAPASSQYKAALALERKPLSQLATIQPPTLPAQLERGVLNQTVLVAKGSGDDNSLLPKPDHSVLNHLAASPIKGGLLAVGVTTRYRRKYVTTVYYKKPVVVP